MQDIIAVRNVFMGQKVTVRNNFSTLQFEKLRIFGQFDFYSYLCRQG